MYPEEPVQKAVEDAYAAFASYARPAKWRAAPGKNGEQLLARLSATPLREAERDAVGRYAHSALYTIGDVDDFKHFLPRILDLAVRDPRHGWIGLDAPIIAAHLQYASWRTWPSVEQDVIGRVFETAFDLRCRLHPGESPSDDWLCGMAALGLDVSGVLQRWLHPLSLEGVLQVAHLTGLDLEHLARADVEGGYWTFVDSSNRQSIVQWLLTDEVRSGLTWGLGVAVGDDVADLERALTALARQASC